MNINPGSGAAGSPAGAPLRSPTAPSVSRPPESQTGKQPSPRLESRTAAWQHPTQHQTKLVRLTRLDRAFVHHHFLIGKRSIMRPFYVGPSGIRRGAKSIRGLARRYMLSSAEPAQIAKDWSRGTHGSSDQVRASPRRRDVPPNSMGEGKRFRSAASSVAATARSCASRLEQAIESGSKTKPRFCFAIMKNSMEGIFQRILGGIRKEIPRLRFAARGIAVITNGMRPEHGT